MEGLETQLLDAIYSDDAEFLRNNVDTFGVNTHFEDNGVRVTLLFYAVRRGCISCARVLLQKGADPQLESVGGYTPIFAALQHEDMLRLLLEFGAHVNVSRSSTSLIEEAYFYNENMLPILIDYGILIEPHLEDEEIIVKIRNKRSATQRSASIVLCSKSKWFCRDVRWVIAKHLFTMRLL